MWEKGIILDAEFNFAQLSMNIDYNTYTTNLNLTTNVNFDKYRYNIQSYQTMESDEIECFTVSYIKFCLFPLKCRLKTIQTTDNFINLKKEFSESILINY